MEKLKVLDLFSGIGGFTLALHEHGHKTVAFSEIEEYPSKILKQQWPDVPNLGDITKIYQKIDVDMIVGGFPCQDISCANTQGKGLDGERSGLWKEYKRLIELNKPRVVIIENTSNIRSRGLTEVLKDLWQIGYASRWDIYPASNFGASHRRERCFIVAHANEAGLQRFFKSYSDSVESIYKERFSECRFDSTRPFSPEAIPEDIRMDDGIPNRAHRVKALGNSVYVPVISVVVESIANALISES